MATRFEQVIAQLEAGETTAFDKAAEAQWGVADDVVCKKLPDLA